MCLTAKDRNRPIETKDMADLKWRLPNLKLRISVQSCLLRKANCKGKLTMINFTVSRPTRASCLDASELSTLTPIARHKQSRIGVEVHIGEFFC